MKSEAVKQEMFAALRGLLQGRAAGVNRQTASGKLPDDAGAHPDSGELAAFFYGKAKTAGVAAHVAACRSCADELALYVEAERAARRRRPTGAHVAAEKIPAAAWRLIAEWEESDFAKPKALDKTTSREVLDKLARLVLRRQAANRQPSRHAVSSPQANRVPVLVVNRQGELRGVELFERATNRRGDLTLVHAEKSSRFDDVELHAVTHPPKLGDRKSYDIESFRVHHGRVRVGKRADDSLTADDTEFFIIEE